MNDKTASKDQVHPQVDDLDTLELTSDPKKGTSVPYIVVLAGETVGKVIRLHADRVMKLGRARHCELFFDCENISREHVLFETHADGRITIKDLGSTNGTLVNGKQIKCVDLCDGDRICMGSVILRFTHQDDLEYDVQQSLYDHATRDPLTGAFNRRFFMETFHKEFSFHNRQNMPLSLIMFDLDNFKRLNDTYGHSNGDIVLRTLGKDVISCMRSEDLFARFGGEEFVALFRCTSRKTACIIAQKILDLVKAMKFTTLEAEFGTSITIGLATLEEQNYESTEDMLMAADQNLYIGKNQGKGVVIG